jgi:hypothetical protein
LAGFGRVCRLYVFCRLWTGRVWQIPKCPIVQLLLRSKNNNSFVVGFVGLGGFGCVWPCLAGFGLAGFGLAVFGRTFLIVFGQAVFGQAVSGQIWPAGFGSVWMRLTVFGRLWSGRVWPCLFDTKLANAKIPIVQLLRRSKIVTVL